jgi:hypothetical protein
VGISYLPNPVADPSLLRSAFRDDGMEQASERFRAVSDEGKEFIVIKYRRFTEDRDLSGTSIRELVPRFRLSDGSPVNQIDAEAFEIAETHQIIRKV